MNDNKPYLVDAVIGNGRTLASIGRTGRIYRLWWPHIDFPQHVDVIRTGLKMDGFGDGTVWFDEADAGWTHEIAYVPRTNIVQIDARSDRYPLEVAQRDFAVPDADIVVRDYAITNRSDAAVSFSFVWYSSFQITESALYNTTMFHAGSDSLIHYRQRTFFCDFQRKRLRWISMRTCARGRESRLAGRQRHRHAAGRVARLAFRGRRARRDGLDAGLYRRRRDAVRSA
ncbi:hypothetical protein OMP38_17615 [Cohnella ginsengisoli]|uniref:Uncharacterized protein n=1 Tax=Cohnella ginsengisoli TaxID=425004 RepID=A0A9X4KIA8_9BACL|nr:hypothetical protein [Cohnella ginsengisoli]MDG0792490.1 hypothetical protein [Cohnella ginsengisoli]